MMPSAAAAIAALLFYAVQMGQLGEPTVGVGAYYHAVDLRGVCEYRVQQGWNPGLDCDWPCLAASIEADWIGDYVLADLPGHSMVLCEIADCARIEDKPALLSRGEVIEIDGGTAADAGWIGYTDNVRIWRLGR